METHVALSGYCPVSLVSDRKLVPGQAEYSVTHEGRLYRFANMLTFNLFRRDPERFVPVNNGNCPVNQVELGKQQPGNPNFGVLYQGRLYLCATDADRKQFFSSPDRYAAVDVAEQGLCPHCLAQSGERIPGDPRYDLTQGGRRYWFPDPTHREAFLSASPNDLATVRSGVFLIRRGLHRRRALSFSTSLRVGRKLLSKAHAQWGFGHTLHKVWCSCSRLKHREPEPHAGVFPFPARGAWHQGGELRPLAPRARAERCLDGGTKGRRTSASTRRYSGRFVGRRRSPRVVHFHRPPGTHLDRARPHPDRDGSGSRPARDKSAKARH